MTHFPNSTVKKKGEERRKDYGYVYTVFNEKWKTFYAFWPLIYMTTVLGA